MRLTQCPRCQRFADKYVEYDFVVLFIDLVLIKPQVSFKRALADTKLADMSGHRCTDISCSIGSGEMTTSSM